MPIPTMGDGENDAVGIRPHLVRVLDAPDPR